MSGKNSHNGDFEIRVLHCMQNVTWELKLKNRIFLYDHYVDAGQSVHYYTAYEMDADVVYSNEFENGLVHCAVLKMRTLH